MARTATGSDVVVQVTPTVTAGAYSAGNSLGGLLQFANGLRTVAGSTKPAAQTATLLDLVITDKGNQKPTLTILFLRAVAGTYADKTSPNIKPDNANIIGQVSVASGSWVTSGADSLAVAEVGPGAPVLLETTDGTANIYAVALVTGTPTPASSTDYVFTLKIRQD